MKKVLFITSLTLLVFISLAAIAPLSFAWEGYRITTSFPGSKDIVAGKPVKGDGGVTLAKYIQQIYIFALSIVGITGLIMLIRWGVTITVSAGDEAKIRNARDGIWQAILGMALLLAAFLLLNSINPDLVRLGQTENRLINVPSIKQNWFEGHAE